MKALILYFSGTGNTKYATQIIKKYLEKKEIEVTLRSIEDKSHLEMKQYDMLILGAPKYYEYPAMPLLCFLKKELQSVKKTIPVFAFCTQSSYTSTNFKEVQSVLKAKNYLLSVAKSYALANNMVIMEAIKPTQADVMKKNIQTLKTEVEEDLEKFLSQKIDIETPSRAQRVIGYISGHVFTKIFPLFMMKYSVNKADCIQCKKCAKQCPAHNIKMENGYPVFSKQCIFCMRCINRCPQNAILYKQKKRNQYKLQK